MKRTLDITMVPVKAVLLAWLSPLMEQYKEVLMTEEQMNWLSQGQHWGYLRGKPIRLMSFGFVQKKSSHSGLVKS